MTCRSLLIALLSSTLACSAAGEKEGDPNLNPEGDATEEGGFGFDTADPTFDVGPDGPKPPCEGLRCRAATRR
jgi:hypothetical protein